MEVISAILDILSVISSSLQKLATPQENDDQVSLGQLCENLWTLEKNIPLVPFDPTQVDYDSFIMLEIIEQLQHLANDIRLALEKRMETSIRWPRGVMVETVDPDDDINILVRKLKVFHQIVAQEIESKNWSPVPQQLNHEKLEVCKYFKIRVHYHDKGKFWPEFSTLDKFICNRGDADTSKARELWSPKSSTGSKGDKPHEEQKWRWVHLPANNKRWAKDLIRVLYIENQRDSSSSKIRPLEAFIDESYHEYRGSASYARYRKPSYDQCIGGNFSSLVAYQHGGASVEDLHLACTLDQSHYISLSDSSDRDRDQVVFRFSSRNKVRLAEQTGRAQTTHIDTREQYNEPNPRLGKLLMVSQLWLWKIDEDSLNAMIQNILRQCIGFVDIPSNAGLDDNLFDIFEQSIAKLLDSLTNAEDNICDITKEVEHLYEIKDIRDELRMIQGVLEDQKTVLEKYSNSKGTSQEGGLDPSIGHDDVLENLNFRQRKAERLYSEAGSVELKNLLDLKQKQGNLNEARDMRKLADEAEKRAVADRTQSQLIFVFTLVTVVYTPIAFTSSFFAIPSSDFPRGNNGDGAAWRWWQIFVGSLVAEIATLSVICVYWWRHSHGIHGTFKSLGSAIGNKVSQLAKAIKVPNIKVTKDTKVDAPNTHGAATQNTYGAAAQNTHRATTQNRAEHIAIQLD
ncbi:hypothetical protein F4779DRAFT_623090 [Xylariaceae sp. FL0662B]|nr:hypothetical protein F4779DRAFT_623090 [Xylariaceae sp. FL0662B]